MNKKLLIPIGALVLLLVIMLFATYRNSTPQFLSKNYSNADYGFSVSYPSTWRVRELQGKFLPFDRQLAVTFYDPQAVAIIEQCEKNPNSPEFPNGCDFVPVNPVITILDSGYLNYKTLNGDFESNYPNRREEMIHSIPVLYYGTSGISSSATYHVNLPDGKSGLDFSLDNTPANDQVVRQMLATLTFTHAKVSSQTPEAYPKGAKGFAISYPQCGKPYPTEYDFGILGANNGRSLTKNPCLKSEIEWAKKGKYPPAFYFNLSYPATQPTKIDAYNFGYRTAKEAHEYAVEEGAGPAFWWIDAQIISSWSDDTTINAQAALGAIAYFKEKNLPVGLSTTPYQWNTITGSLQTGLPTWIPGRDNLEQYCKTGASYSGGPLQQTANVNEDDFEAVLACGE